MSPSFVIFHKSKVILNVARTLSMDTQRRVRILPNGQSSGGTRLYIEDSEHLDSFIFRAANLLWKGKKSGKALFFDNGDEVLELQSVERGDTLYISEGEDWIGISSFFHLM